uniref:Uncharacterized protein n=1 Tax=Arion vulgaris TaxID=1028688 RepID=A0A0B7AJE4_9EUPU
MSTASLNNIQVDISKCTQKKRKEIQMFVQLVMFANKIEHKETQENEMSNY